MWYLSDPDWPGPNLTLLQNALQQTGWDGSILDKENWRKMLCQRLERIDWQKSIADVKPFLERTDELELLTGDNIKSLLRC
jgi:hypothetical protein